MDRTPSTLRNYDVNVSILPPLHLFQDAPFPQFSNPSTIAIVRPEKSGLTVEQVPNQFRPFSTLTTRGRNPPEPPDCGEYRPTPTPKARGGVCFHCGFPFRESRPGFDGKVGLPGPPLQPPFSSNPGWGHSWPPRSCQGPMSGRSCQAETASGKVGLLPPFFSHSSSGVPLLAAVSVCFDPSDRFHDICTTLRGMGDPPDAGGRTLDPRPSLSKRHQPLRKKAKGRAKAPWKLLWEMGIIILLSKPCSSNPNPCCPT